MSVGGINFSGLSSGIDSNSIIQQLLTIERQPETLLKSQITQLQNRQTAYNTLSAQLLSLQSNAQTLDSLRAFDLVTAGSSDSTIATATAQTGAQTGSHTIVISNLAQAQRVSSIAQTSQTAPLGFSGQIIVNGKAINVQASDSLTTLAGNINSAQPGVNASIISPSPNQYYLTLGSANTGLQGQISISDTSGGAFLGTTLGLFGAGTTLRHSVSATVAGSDLLADSATSVATLEGQTAIPPAQGSVSITSGGVTQNVTIDLGRSLSGIADDINTVFGSSVATVATVTDPISGSSRQQLQISGITGAGDFVDSNNVLANLGIVQKNYGAGRELQVAKDAVFTLDGLPANRPTNSFSDAISGVTINLLKDTGTVTLGVSNDTTTIKSNISAFVKSFNDTVDTVSSFSQFDPTTNQSGTLLGDITSQNIVDNLVSNVSGLFTGLPSNLSLLSQAGITLDQGSHLVIDDGKLTAALASNLKGVAKLFQSAGTPSDPTIQFVSGTGDTKPSGSNGYAVNITQPATQAVVTAGSALAGTLSQDEVLIFGGPIFGSSATPPLTGGYQLTLRQGSSLSDIVSQINGDARLGPKISASIVSNKLTLTSKSYGSLTEFAVVSTIPTGTGTTSGIGTTVLDQKGQDVAGTINGEAAIGTGQFLTGSQRGGGTLSNGSALGLQIRVTASAAGSYGNITYSSGAADIVKNYVTTQTDTFKGALSTAVNGFQDNIKDIQSNIDEIEARVKDSEQILRQQFTTLETTVARLKTNSAGLAQLSVSTFSSTSSSSK